MKTVFIYGLVCPITDQVRYIGKSAEPLRRLVQHCSAAECSTRTLKANWIASLLNKGLRPRLKILSEVSEDFWQIEERYFIASFRMVGSLLTNATDGGDGVTMTPATREKIALALSNPSMETRAKRSHAARNRSPETRAKMSVAACNREYSNDELAHIRSLANRRTSEHIQKMAASLRGKTLSSDAIAKRTASVLGSKRSTETKAKMAAAQIGKKASEETRAKLAAAHKGRTLPPEQREKMAEAQRQRWARIKVAQQNQASQEQPAV